MTVDIDNLRALFELLAKENVAEFEHEAQGVRVRIVRGGVAAIHARTAPPAPHSGIAATSPAAIAAAAAHAPAAAETPLDSVDITSPFVGTFYRSPSPDAPPFVDVGSVVRKGQTLCIVEAMKLMNDIEAEVSGTIVEVYAQNGKSVEFGQKLFRIKKA
jgi:acetyl-CoA carboxylase biotin carboxyl carrier protein